MGYMETQHVGPLDTPFVMGGETFRSRLLVGTGKYRDFAQTRDAIEASGAQLVTVAPLLARALRNIHDRTSISVLFQS